MSPKPYVAREHEFEAAPGLPEALPAGERIVWQGAPSWDSMARQAFHADAAALYFAALLLWRVFSQLGDGAGLGAALISAAWLTPLFAAGLGALCLLGWLSARTTLYTLTNQRVVMRVGMVLVVTYNLPLKRIESANLRPAAMGRGDIALALEPATRIAYLHLWPHVRPWHVARPMPMLRGIEQAERVAALLRQTWAEANGQTATASASTTAVAPEHRTRALAVQ
jgi:hypothetical protein